MTRSNDHTELAWAAAFLESEGSIYWVRKKTLVVAAYNTETVLLRRFQRALNWQTGIYKMRKTEYGRRQVYVVRAKSGQAEIAITKLLPYLTRGSSKEVRAREALEARQLLR